MRQHLVHVHPQLGAVLQQVPHELPGALAHRSRRREDELRQLLLGLAVAEDVLDVALEGGAAEEQLVGEDAEAPGVDLVGVAFLEELFGRGVLEAADDGVAQAGLVVVDGAAEVADLDIALR